MVTLSMQMIPPTMLAALPELAGAYVFCLIVGGGLLVISTVFGGHHDMDVDTGGALDGGLDLSTDTDLDFDADLDADAALSVDGGHVTEAMVHQAETDALGGHHDGALGLSNWFSVRFVVYFCAMFGLVGTVLTYLTDAGPGWTLGIALVAGIGMGQLVHQLIRSLQRSGVSSESRITDLVHKPGRVTIAVRPPARGEVGVCVGDREIFLPAVAQRSDDVFETGAQVMITSYSGGLAEVVSRQEYEFKHNA
ncbi:MAG TPA: hypothetical protein P5572_19510 [Phycisphaerae bacterium]|nr:hypothetical protein [Phycisphaerae bacterium]